MNPASVLRDPLEALVLGPDREALRVGLLVPRSGVLGLTGPAAIASSVLAAEEINHAGGVRGHRVELVPIDAGTDPIAVADEVGSLISARAVEVLLGFHTSDVHRRVERVTSGRIPYLFTPPHEGGPRLPGVALLGENPTEQLLPIISHFTEAGRRRRRWALIGNDYIWPRAVHAAAITLLRQRQAQVVMLEAVPFGKVDAERLVDRLSRTGADAVLLSLVGRDLATFNRVFAETTLVGRMVRVSGALDETGLLEIGGDDTGDLYASMRWFASDPDLEGFAERYHNRWGELAPRLGVYAAGCYHGLQLLATLGNAELLNVDIVAAASARADHRAPTRLARAEGLELVSVP